MKLGKFMTGQVVNIFGHFWWLSVISTPDIYPQPPCLESFWDSPILMKGGRKWFVCPPPCCQDPDYLAWFSLDVLYTVISPGKSASWVMLLILVNFTNQVKICCFIWRILTKLSYYVTHFFLWSINMSYAWNCWSYIFWKIHL